jgi:exopolyphosphatase / guanosine-5'-triphosphate,3'-diphosphate pyrophosphatase
VPLVEHLEALDGLKRERERVADAELPGPRGQRDAVRVADRQEVQDKRLLEVAVGVGPSQVDEVDPLGRGKRGGEKPVSEWGGGYRGRAMRVAAVDLGTHTTRLLVADVEDGRIDEVERDLVFTSLGEGVDGRRRLLPVPIARVRNCLADYRRRIEQLGADRTLAVGTSAIRDAENGEAFLGEIEWSYGFATRLLNGEEEARLAFRGATAGREVADDTLVIDVGGGSTELVTGDGFHASVDLGSVRLTERFLDSDPPTRAELAACADHIRSALPPRLKHANAIGVAGTVTTLAALDLGLDEYDSDRVHGHRIPAAATAGLLDGLAALPLAERRNVPALEPERAPVIVAGAMILRELLAWGGLDEIEASEHDLLHGIALEAAELPEPVEGAAPPGAYTCC